MIWESHQLVPGEKRKSFRPIRVEGGCHWSPRSVRANVCFRQQESAPHGQYCPLHWPRTLLILCWPNFCTNNLLVKHTVLETSLPSCWVLRDYSKEECAMNRSSFTGNILFFPILILNREPIPAPFTLASNDAWLTILSFKKRFETLCKLFFADRGKAGSVKVAPSVLVSLGYGAARKGGQFLSGLSTTKKLITLSTSLLCNRHYIT